MAAASAAAVRAFRAGWLAERAAGRVETGVGRRIGAALDYTRSARTLTIIDGPARIGKSFAARAWCEASAGLACYVETPCSVDETSFLHRLAQALGVSINLKSRALDLRLRVEEVLQGGDLMLVMDEAHYLWPQGRSSDTVPGRVNFVNTTLINSACRWHW
jgi:DNA transposition AAA+ family ATPase